MKVFNPKGKVCLAPMAGFSDRVFRKICREMDAGFVYSEMVSADGILQKNSKTEDILHFEKEERPIGIQIFGSDPGKISDAAKVIADREKPDFIDINFGCPVKKVINRNAGAALLKDLKLLEAICLKTVKAMEKQGIPVSAKIRAGWSDNSLNYLETGRILEQSGIAFVAFHPRSMSQGFKGRAPWERIQELKARIEIPVIGNGDVKTPEDAVRLLRETSCDSVMIGRGALGNPWIFKSAVHFLTTETYLPPPSPFEKVFYAVDQLMRTIEYMGETGAILFMRKHFACYSRGLFQGSKLRRNIFNARTLSELNAVVRKYLENDVIADYEWLEEEI